MDHETARLVSFLIGFLIGFFFGYRRASGGRL